MFLFTPRYLKHGRQFIKDARKLIAYKRDLVSEEVISDVEREIAHLEHAVAGKQQNEVEAQMDRLNKACEKLTKPSPHAHMRENVEVFLVAIVIALAVRTYFLQPFTIPTGSMQPTLNGILPHSISGPLPNPLVQALHFAAFGREYVELIAKSDESFYSSSGYERPIDRAEGGRDDLPPSGLFPAKRGGYRRLFDYTRIVSSAGNEYFVHADVNTVGKMLNFNKQYKAGETIFRGYIETGDHVFVDKVSYNFRTPRRGEVFVFSTATIPSMPAVSQFYIKRLVGLPGDLLRIEPPQLLVNGHPAGEPGIVRVMEGARTDEAGRLLPPPPDEAGVPRLAYNGYTTRDRRRTDDGKFLAEDYNVPPKKYFAMGDNSYNSSDSRYWGTVPERNIMGRAIFVYWPFTKHWSLID